MFNNSVQKFVNRAFQMTVDTTKAGSASDTMIIPTTGTDPYDCTVDWGDGNTIDYTGLAPTLEHTYDIEGEYTISITGTFPRVFFNNTGDRYKLIKILNFGDVGWTSMYYAFRGCSSMTSVISGDCNTENVDNMNRMFYFCTAITDMDMSTFDTSSVLDMYGLFNTLREMTSIDISNFNTALVIDMSGLFNNCSLITELNLSNFDTSSVENFSFAFYNMNALVSLDVSGLDTGAATNMYYMFGNDELLETLDISGFDISNVTNLTNILRDGDNWIDSQYDDVLLAWSTQTVKPNLIPNFGDAKYQASSQAARDILTSAPNNWIITDGGLEV